MIRTSQKRKISSYGIYFVILFVILVIFGYYIISSKNSYEPKAPITDTQFALNTVVSVTIYDSTDTSILNGAFELCNKYEKIFSRTLESSELYKLNHSSQLTSEVSADLASLVKTGLEYSKSSKGAFDISIAPVSQLWDFTAEDPVVPVQTKIKAALSHVGYQNFTINGTTLSRESKEEQLDLGAIAKGYIADRIKEYLLNQGVKSAVISLGGNILCVGNKNGEPFNIGIQAPFKEHNKTLASIKVSDKSIVTSGIYERCFTKDGILYHHILNPKTGYPYENDLSSVTIISDKSVNGDALSTTCFVLGLEKGMSYIDSIDDTYAIFVNSEGKIYYSEGLEQEFSMKKNS